MRVPVVAPVVLLGLMLCSAQTDPVADAVEALQRGNAAAAEVTLRAELRAHPNNADALGVLGVVLDQQKKYAEADDVYERAVALTPRSTPLLNNYGNHLLATEKIEEARKVFLKVVALNPAHANATMQLARIAVQRKSPSEALRYLERLPAGARQQPEVEMTRMQALFELRRNTEAESTLAQLVASAGADGRAHFELGTALAGAGQYEKAEERFSRALELAPGNFDVLYNLGLAASHAGHNERARDILQSALRQQPQNAYVMYDLAAVNARLGRKEEAVRLLAEAARMAPERAEIQQLLARTTADLGYFGDAVQAWDRYLKLVPGDEVARRERAFAASALGDDVEGAVAALRAYASRHSSDPVGHYELGVAEAAAAREEATTELDRALQLKPDLGAARIARGLLFTKQGKFAAALPDFEAAAAAEPANAVVLDRLGQTYLALDRAADAVRVLRRAAELAPRDSKTLMHLGRALIKAGQEQEAEQVFARFRELGPDRSGEPHPAGLVDFLSLSPADQLARYRAGVERTVRKNPDNAEAQVRYLKLLLADGNTEAASGVARHLLQLAPSAPLLREAGDALLDAQQYAIARELLGKAAAIQPGGDVQVELAIAAFHAVNAQAGLAELERVPNKDRGGDYSLARAEMLGAAGRRDEAAAALDQALHKNPRRSDLYRYAVAFLVGSNRSSDALALLDRGSRTLPDNPDIPLLRAIALVAAARMENAGQAIQSIENRWPDWYKVWLANAILLEWKGQHDRAEKAFETAMALGAGSREQHAEQAANSFSTPADRARALMQAIYP